MAKIHAYLNFDGQCEDAFKFYEKVFKTQISYSMRFGDMPANTEVTISDEDKNKILHTSIKINADTMLMGSDNLEVFGQKVVSGNNTYVMLDTSTAEEAKELYSSLSQDAKNIEMALGETFFAEQYASFIDQFGIAWMIHFEGNKAGSM